MTARKEISSCQGDFTRRGFLGTMVGAGIALATGCESPRPNSTSRATPVVDTHMHVWAKHPSRYPFPYPYSKDFRGPPKDATIEMLLDDMDRNGCTHAILVQCIYHGWDNAYVADSLAHAPHRLRAHGLIDPADPKVADKLEYWIVDRGLHGMRFSPVYYQDGQHGGDAWLDAPETHALWERAEKYDAVFNFFIAPAQLQRLGTMAQAHPNVRVVVDHVGNCNVRADDPAADFRKLTDLARFSNVWVKVSELTAASKTAVYPFEDTWPWVKRVYEAFGPDRLLWGTGYPGASRAANNRPTLADEIDLIRTRIPFFSDEDREKILGRNAVALWGLA